MPGHHGFAESAKRWVTTCTVCGQRCEGGHVKELALGHVMHLTCYDRWLESQDDAARRAAMLRNFATTDALRRRMEEWVASARWIRR
jgi:hypothetical protein